MVLVKDINRENFLDVLGKANAAEHAVHNNGYFFNKFMSKLAFDMGTQGAWNSSNVSEAFNVYYAADAALSKRRAKIPQLQDSVETLKYASKHGPTYWRKNPIAVDKKAPMELQVAIECILVDGKGILLHCGGGDFINSSNEKFVPCGHDECEMCKHWLQNLENIKMEQVKKELAHALGITNNQMIDTSFEVDMWLSDKTLLGQDDITLQLCEKIHESNYEYDIITLEQLKMLYDSTTPEMEGHTGVMKILTKYFNMNMDKLGDEFLNMMDKDE